jgi:delta24(24(1))-sterol reductase
MTCSIPEFGSQHEPDRLRGEFDHCLAYLYLTFFLIMILHRAGRDISRCKNKHGADWDRSCEEVPSLFIPYGF